MELDVLLSDQFIEFSHIVEEAAKYKKQLKADFKLIYEQYQTDLKSLDNKVMEAQAAFEEWKQERAKNTGDG